MSSNKTTIDPTARIETGAVIGDGASIGPYCVIGPHAVIGEDCRLVAHVHVAGHTTVGARTAIQPFASLGSPPQSASYGGGPTRLEIGTDCDIRESVTMNLGTEKGGGVTTVGSHGMFMANSHVGHDCHVGDHVIFANGATLGGHCDIGSHVFLSGHTAVHQFCRIGESAMVSGISGLRADLIPFGMAVGDVSRLAGLNLVSLRRRGFGKDAITAVRAAYRRLFHGEGLFRDRVDAVGTEFGKEPAVALIIDFIRAAADRPLCQPSKRHGG